MGIYYFGYMPSFWIRLRCLGPLTMPTLLPAVLPAGSPVFGWPIIQRLLASSADWFTWGALVQWWTMFSIVTADGTSHSLAHTSPRALAHQRRSQSCLTFFLSDTAQSSPTLRARTLARRLSSPSARGRPGRASGADASVRWPRSAGVRLSCDGLDRCSRAPSMASCAR